ncbi:hypothetical protein Cs7R123_28780 [Catellatospora sp. TT07R-123]|uniref:C40 family peptidase n=1 Tax=Catellatospora sp. TT07R-123 TaxID=2733863 RepID=UPI001B2EAE3A|nr:C40 family peptidase [Catellatospora sp. TT07R-123]GHJ45536.1 hypothetical protein Cs7R123_28780 [Catellatospora sp. TT07R-123]
MPSHHGRGWRIAVRLLAPAVALIGVAAAGTPAHAQPSAAELRQQISTKSAQLERVVESYNKLDSQLKTNRTRVAQLEHELAPLQERADSAHRNVAALAVTAYQTGRLDTWNALLAGGGHDAVLSRLTTIDHLATDQQEQVTAAHSAAADQFQAKSELEQQAKDLTTRAAAIAAQRRGIEAELKKLEQLRRQAGLSDERGSSYTGTVPSVSGRAGAAVAYAYKALGKPYVWAADGPSGYDCSGLTLAAWRSAGVSLYHQAATQWNETTRIKRSQLAPGDLVFYSGLGHVALYIGNGKVIHAPTFGEVVKISSVDMMTPYGYGRVRT